MIERLCIIGVGLIGGSLARALREKGFCQHVVGAGRSAAHLQKALFQSIQQPLVLLPFLQHEPLIPSLYEWQI